MELLLRAIPVILSSFILTNRVFAQSPDQRSLEIGTSFHSIQMKGQQRTYLVHIPRKYIPGTKVAAVLVLHGAGGNAKNALAQGKWIEKSEREGFIAVAPNGTLKDPSRLPSLANNPRGWNDGGIPVSAPDRRREVDDIGFIDALIDNLLQTGAIDRHRIYITGFSNGAGMTFRAGVELSNRVAAIAPVANGLLVNAKSLQYPVSLISIWGAADPLNPIDGGTVTRSGFKVVRPSAASSWQTWSKLLNCPPTPKTISKQQNFESKAFSSCDRGSEALFYRVEGLGHSWPGGRERLPAAIIGKTSNAIDATDLIWAFFAKHSRD